MENNTALPNKNGTENPIWELDERSFVQHVMKRPGMYVGAPRLDYMQHFINGFGFGNKSVEKEKPWNIDYELQHWLMQNQCISIRHGASISGWNLFYACFGVHKKALQQFGIFLHSEVPQPNAKEHYDAATASRRIFKKYAKWHYDEERPIQECQKAAIDCIKDMISDEKIEHDLVRIYMRRRHLFSQVRFILHTPNGWVGEEAIIGKLENYQKLITLHACLDCLDDLQYKRLSDFTEHEERYISVYIDEEDPKDMSLLEEVQDEDSFYHHFEEWKLHMTAGY